jgi:putative N6-adenine-specific DNA methylase
LQPILTPAGLARRLKRHVLKETQRFFATTTPGFEEVLGNEVRGLPGAEIIGKALGGVEFSGPLELMYHAAARLRSANRIIMRMAKFTARSYPELYNKVKQTPIERYSGFTTRIGIEASATVSRLHHTGNIEKSVFEACRDRLCPLGIAPERDDDAPLRFLVRMSDDVCTLSIDASGPFLYKRGYRLDTGHAPLRETIAAGLLLLSDWRKFPVIADPLCGSGTFIIEAALLALGRNPGVRRPCAFQAWPCFNEGLWDRIRKKPWTGADQGVGMPRLVGSDISGSAVKAAIANAERAGVTTCASFSLGTCLEFNADGAFDRPGLIIANLPYGKRAISSGVPPQEFFQRFGRRLRKACRGWNWGFVTEDRQFATKAGLQSSGCMPFANGGLDVYFVTGTIA